MKIQILNEKEERSMSDEIFEPLYDCPNCDTDMILQKEFKFCPICGEKIEWVAYNG